LNVEIAREDVAAERRLDALGTGHLLDCPVEKLRQVVDAHLRALLLAQVVEDALDRVGELAACS
jgi:hypothetical protein